MLTERRVVAAKIESVEGTAEALAAADGGILAIKPKFTIEVEKVQREITTASLSRYNDLIGKVSAKISFKAEIKGAGSAYAANNVPALSKYIRSAGFAETIDVTASAEKATYDPASTGVPSLTMAVYEDGVIKKLRGARCSKLALEGKGGGNVFADFEFTGVFDGVTDGAVLTPTFESTDPPVMLGVPFSYDSVSTFVSDSFSIEIVNSLTLRRDYSVAEGYLSAILTGRDVRGKADPEMELAATYDYHAKMLTRNLAALSIGDIGATQYNKFKVTAPKVSITDVQEAEREGIDVADLALQYGRDAGDDEVQFIFS